MKQDRVQLRHSKGFEVSRAGAYFILSICLLLYMVNYMDRQVFSVTTQAIKAEMGLNDSQIGIIQTLFLLGMALFSFPAAFIVDRWSRKKAISLMAVLWSGFTYLTGLGRSFAGILMPRVLVGVGEAGFTSGGTPLIAAAFPREARSRAMGVFNLAIPLGSAAGMILGGAIVQRYDWRMPFLLFAIPGVLLGVLALFMKDYKTVDHADAGGQRIGFVAAALSLFEIRSLKWLYIGFAMQSIMSFSFLQWGVPFVMRMENMNAEQAGLKIGIVGLMSIVGSLAGGVLADKWQEKNPRGRMYTPVLGLALATVLFVVTMLFDFQGIGYAIGVVFGGVLVLGVPALSAISQDVAPPSLKGVSWGMNVFCMYMLGGGWGPWVVGEISDALGGGAHGLKVGLLLSSIGGVAGTVCFYLGARHYPGDVEKVSHLQLERE